MLIPNDVGDIYKSLNSHSFIRIDYGNLWIVVGEEYFYSNAADEAAHVFPFRLWEVRLCQVQGRYVGQLSNAVDKVSESVHQIPENPHEVIVGDALLPIEVVGVIQSPQTSFPGGINVP